MEPTISLSQEPCRRARALPTMRSAVIGLAFILFTGLCVVPVIYMIGVSVVNGEGKVNLENYRRLLVETRQRELLFNSTLLGASSAALGTLLGAPLGLLLHPACVL